MGDGVHSTTPVKVPGGHRFAQLSTYGRHTCGITVEGKAYCWGSNSWGVLGDGSNLGHSFTPVPVAGNLTFRSVSVGSDHSCGVTTNDRGYCWGNGQWRQLGNGTSASSGVPVEVIGGRSWARIAAGAAFTCGVTTNGAAYCWGANSIGQLGDGGKIAYGNVFIANPNQVVGGLTFRSVSLGNQYTCALTTTGQAYCWGSDNTKLGQGNKGDSSSPVAVSGGLTFHSISAGFGHACGVTTAFEVYCWGSNGSGQLGAPVTNGSGIPVRAGGTLDAVEVAASGIGTGSGSHSCAISRDRLTVSCWGRNDVGQLGNGSTTVAATPNVNPSIVIGQKPLPAN
jgi:alpha-tubulin suppressor-like RCC1 family protein